MKSALSILFFIATQIVANEMQPYKLLPNDIKKFAHIITAQHEGLDRFNLHLERHGIWDPEITDIKLTIDDKEKKFIFNAAGANANTNYTYEMTPSGDMPIEAFPANIVCFTASYIKDRIKLKGFRKCCSLNHQIVQQVTLRELYNKQFKLEKSFKAHQKFTIGLLAASVVIGGYFFGIPKNTRDIETTELSVFNREVSPTFIQAIWWIPLVMLFAVISYQVSRAKKVQRKWAKAQKIYHEMSKKMDATYYGTQKCTMFLEKSICENRKASLNDLIDFFTVPSLQKVLVADIQNVVDKTIFSLESKKGSHEDNNIERRYIDFCVNS